MQPLCVVSGDIHLDEYIWRRLKFITGDAGLGFASTVDHALERRCPLVLNGDVFDNTTPSSEMISFFRVQMDRCAAAGIAVYALQGNHDKTTPPWFTAVHPYPVYIGNGKPFKLGDRTCIGLDYAIQDDIALAITKLPKTPVDILFLHQAAKQALGFEGAWNLDLTTIPPNIRLVVLSDIHKPLHFDLGPTTAVYTGASCPRDMDQVGLSTCLAVHQDLSFSHLPSKARKIARLPCTTTEELGECRRWLEMAKEGPNPLPPLLWVLSSSEMLVEANSLTGIHADAFVHIVPIPAGGTAKDVVYEDMGAVDELGINTDDFLKRLLNKPGDETALELVKALLTDEDHVADTIRVRYDKHLKGTP